jgi:hypothetical protein
MSFAASSLLTVCRQSLDRTDHCLYASFSCPLTFSQLSSIFLCLGCISPVNGFGISLQVFRMLAKVSVQMSQKLLIWLIYQRHNYGISDDFEYELGTSLLEYAFYMLSFWKGNDPWMGRTFSPIQTQRMGTWSRWRHDHRGPRLDSMGFSSTRLIADFR